MPTVPSTLGAWRNLEPGEPAQTAWEQFRPFLESHGYKLFIVPDSLSVISLIPPPDCRPVRCEDEYNRFLPPCLAAGMPPKRSRFRPDTGINSAARSPEDTDVVIRIMAIGNEGQEHLAIMRALAALPENRRTVPMVAELQKDDVVFGVFPMMWAEGMYTPWFKTVREVLDALEQVLEGFAYLHEQLIAHRDFHFFEVFSNYGYDWDFHHYEQSGRCIRVPPVLRSVCPELRYRINDFELSVQFSPDSDPATRLVTGVPVARYGLAAEDYCKPLAPEILLNKPYCPFKADIFQFGSCALGFWENINDVAGLQELFTAMASDDPDARPTAAQALARLRAVRLTASEDALNDTPLNKAVQCWHLLDKLCTCRDCLRGTTIPTDQDVPQRPSMKPANKYESRLNV